MKRKVVFIQDTTHQIYQNRSRFVENTIKHFWLIFLGHGVDSAFPLRVLCRNVPLIVDTMSLLTPKLLLVSLLCKQAQSNWNFNTVCRMVLFALDYLGWSLGHKITAFRNDITLKAPPGEWMYCVTCIPRLLTVSPTQTEFFFISNSSCTTYYYFYTCACHSELAG